jgi:hypothetical protein
MKFHIHVGVVECVDAATLEQALAIAGCEARVLARPAENVAVLEQDDAAELLRVLEDKGLHPRIMR